MISGFLLLLPLGDLVTLEVPRDLPAHVELAMPLRGATRVASLSKVSNRAEGFRLISVGADGREVEVTPPPVSTYRGELLGEPAATVAASLGPAGWTALVTFEDGGRLSIEPEGAAGLHHVEDAPPLDLGDRCAALSAGATSAPTTPGADGGASGCLDVAEIAFDSDFEYYSLSGSSVASVSTNIETALNAGNLMYARDVLIEHQITTIIVRIAEPDPYTTFDPYALLDAFRLHWISTYGGLQRDVAHLVTGRDMDGGIIGLAWLTVICNSSWGYGLSQFTYGPATDADVLAHELGHNWSAPHCLDEGGTSVMCGGGTIAMGEVTEQLVLNYKQGLSCLGSASGLTASVPPHARDDHAQLDGSGTIDVLANDHDGNCDAVTILLFDATTALGGSVQLSPGTGPLGRDELAYTPPPGGVHGIDTFNYMVTDGAFSPDTAQVRVTDLVPDLLAHYKLNESGGLLAIDSSGNNLHGVYLPGVVYGVPGATSLTDTAVEFTGSTGYVSLANYAALKELDRELTVAAWVRPDGLGGVQRILANPTSWSFGFSGFTLSFTAHNLQEYAYQALLAPGVWRHVAVAFDSNFDATFFIDGNLMATKAGAMPAAFTGSPWGLGALDASQEGFDGAIDDVQIYAGALTEAQVRCLVESAQSGSGFHGEPAFLSLSQGGQQELALCSVGVEGAGDLYLVLGTLSGTTPGFGLAGFTVPLNPDVYFSITLNSPNQAPLLDSFGNLNPSGHAGARFSLAPGTNPALSLATVHHAWARIDFARFTLEFVSDAQSVLLLP